MRGHLGCVIPALKPPMREATSSSQPALHQVVTASSLAASTPPIGAGPSGAWRSPLRSPWHGYALACAACSLTTALTLPLHDWLDPVNTVMLFLLTVVLTAARLGRGPAVLASFLSVALFDFFYVPPRWSFAVSNAQYLLTFAVMLTVALVIGHLTIGLRQRATESQQSADRSSALYALARSLAGSLTVEHVVELTARYVRDQLHADMRLLRPAPTSIQARLEDAQPAAAALPADLRLVAQTVYRDQHGITSQQFGEQGETHAVLPLPGSTRCRGVLIISSPHQGSGSHHLEAQRPLLDAVCSLVATSLERLHFVAVAHQTQLEMNDERLRGSILSALSHDIRTPLTSLFGLADALTVMQPPLPQAAHDMAGAMRDQAMRLHRMVSNLLDMARLQSGQQAGQLRLRREWQPIEEVIGASIQLLGRSLDAQQVKVQQPADLPLMSIDAVLMERVFGNLLENASKYGPPHADIHVRLNLLPELLQVSVCNEGAGFPPGKLQEVFGVFERGTQESSIAGIGLGLAICRAIVEAHGGHIEAVNPAQGGAEVRFTLPLGTPPTIEPEAAGPTTPANRGRS
jgi:two-component system sensor histidine kinase KdpD